MTLPNIGDMPEPPAVSDRDLLLYIAKQVDKLHDELETFRPLLNMMKGSNGKPDMVALLQARREVKKAGRHGP